MTLFEEKRTKKEAADAEGYNDGRNDKEEEKEEKEEEEEENSC
jgi:hypothetical protein